MLTTAVGLKLASVALRWRPSWRPRAANKDYNGDAPIARTVAVSLRTLLAILLVLTALLAVTPSQAQATPGNLYLTSTLGVNNPAGCASTDRYTMSDVAPAAGKAYAAMSAGGFACAFSFDYVAGYSGVLSGEQTLTMLVGCDYAGVMIEVDYTFAVGGVVLGTERTSNPAWSCTSSSVFSYVKTFDGKDTVVEPETPMRLTISIFAAASGETGTPTGNFHVKVGGDNAARLSGLGMPGSILPDLAPGLPAVAYQDVTGSALEITQSHVAETSAMVYNWTTELDAAALEYAVNASGGSVTLTLVDGSNATVASEALNGTADVALTSLVPGNWTIRLDYANFTGNVSISLGAPAKIGPDVVPDLNATHNTTASLSSTKDKGSPGPALPLLLTLLAAVVAVTRRK